MWSDGLCPTIQEKGHTYHVRTILVFSIHSSHIKSEVLTKISSTPEIIEKNILMNVHCFFLYFISYLFGHIHQHSYKLI